MNDEFDEERKYNKMYTMLFSMIPGAGHMYLGLMKKGLQFMFVFFGFIIVTDLIYSARSFTVLNIVVWFYAFFDAYHSRRKLESARAVEEDLFAELRLNSAKPKYVGIGLVILGSIVLLQQIFAEVLSLEVIVFPPYIKTAILDSIFPIALVAIGIFILRTSKNKKKSFEYDFDEDEFNDEE